MALLTNRLNDLQIKALSKPGRYVDGQNLYLNISANGAKSWVFLYTLNGKPREMGLGSSLTFWVADARKIADTHRKAFSAWDLGPFKAHLDDGYRARSGDKLVRRSRGGRNTLSGALPR